MSENKMNYQSTRDLFRTMNSKNIVYNKAYYKLTDSLPGAILLSHLAYLWSEVFGGKEFYQSDEQLYRTLGFSERTLRTAKSHTQKYLSSRKIGAPAKNHWVVNEDVLIADLVSLQCVKTSPDENVMTSADETVGTGSVETVPTKKEELNKKELQKNNNNNVVVDRVRARIPGLMISDKTIEAWVADKGEPYIMSKIEMLFSKHRTNPTGWLIDAIKNNYINEASPTLSPPSHEVWSEKLQTKKNKEAEQRMNPNDWREKMLAEQLSKLQAKQG